jgi:hypothetical protein
MPQDIEVWPLQSLSEVLRVHWDSISQSGSCLGSVKVHSLKLTHTFLHSREYVMWLPGILLACTLTMPLRWLSGFLPFSSQPCNPLALVASPKLGLWQAILPIKLASATFLPKISFVIIMGKRDIRNLSVLPSSQSESNCDYNDKICQHLPLSLNQKPRHFSLPLRLCPPRVIPTRMLRRRSTMLTRGRCFKPMQVKFKLYKMNSNHWRLNLLI